MPSRSPRFLATLLLTLVASFPSLSAAGTHLGETIQVMSQAATGDRGMGYVYTNITSPSGRVYSDSVYLPFANVAGVHYTTVTFDELGTWTFKLWSANSLPPTGPFLSNTTLITILSPPVATISVRPSAIYVGDSTLPTVTWNTTNATSTSVSGPDLSSTLFSGWQWRDETHLLPAV